MAEEMIEKINKEVKKARDREARPRSTLDLILNTLPVGVLLIETDSSVSYYSPEIVRILGDFPPETLENISENPLKLFNLDGSEYSVDTHPLLRSIRDGETISGS